MSLFELKRLPLNPSVALVELLNDALANEPIRRVKWNEIKLHQEFFLLKLFLQPHNKNTFDHVFKIMQAVHLYYITHLCYFLGKKMLCRSIIMLLASFSLSLSSLFYPPIIDNKRQQWSFRSIINFMNASAIDYLHCEK